MANEEAEAEAEMQNFFKGVGELVLWASEIDSQLTNAVIRACSLNETPMLEPIIAELNTRPKLNILRAHLRTIENPDWSAPIRRWLDEVDKVITNRNTVAHHRVAVRDGRLTLHTVQARRLLKQIRNLRSGPANNVDDINQWVEEAKNTYQQGQEVLANLGRLAEAMANRQAR